MKTQNTKHKLSFNKKSVIELTDSQVQKVVGGTGFICSNCLTITHSVTITGTGLPGETIIIKL